MPAPATGRELHVDMPLSNIVVGRKFEGYIADQVMPIVNVDKQSGRFFKFNHKEWARHEEGITRRAPATEAKKIGFTVSSDGYYAENYALGAEWPVEDQVNADAVLNWAENNALYVTDRLLRDYEMRIAGMLTTSANVATTFIASSGWNSAGRTVLADLIGWTEGFQDMTGLRPNLLIIPRGVMAKLALNDQLRDINFGDRGGQITATMIGQMLGIDKVLVPTAQVNTAVEKDPQDGTLADIWGGNGNLWLGRVSTMGGQFTDTWAQAFRWTSPLFNTPFAVQRYPFDPKKKVYGIEVSYYQDEKVVSSELMVRVSSLTAT